MEHFLVLFLIILILKSLTIFNQRTSVQIPSVKITRNFDPILKLERVPAWEHFSQILTLFVVIGKVLFAHKDIPCFVLVRSDVRFLRVIREILIIVSSQKLLVVEEVNGLFVF